ncbi:MAG: hypothetical protein WCK10_02745 [Candidatus Staskawiczbacteria bacterium]
MAKILQKQLISSLKQMNNIKPRKEWAVLLKSQILAEKSSEVKTISQPATFAAVINAIFSPKKLSYSFAVILFLIVGVFGFSRYTMPGDLLFPVKKIGEQSVATFSGQTKLNQDILALDNRISELVQVAKEERMNNIPSAISEITEAAKVLKSNSVSDPETIKKLAISLKTLANIPGADLSETSDVKDLYQAVVQAQIADLQNTTLTDAQLEIMTEVKELYLQGRYSAALEKILLINQ